MRSRIEDERAEGYGPEDHGADHPVDNRIRTLVAISRRQRDSPKLSAPAPRMTLPPTAQSSPGLPGGSYHGLPWLCSWDPGLQL
jgi:hypothetical protein